MLVIVLVLEVVVRRKFVVALLSFAVLLLIFVFKLPLRMLTRSLTSLVNIQFDVLGHIHAMVGIRSDVDGE